MSTSNPTATMNSLESPPSETHDRVRRPGGLGLFIAAICVIAATWFAGSVIPAASSNDPYQMGPVTGEEFAAFLVANEERLRAVTTDFDSLLADAKAVADQPMIDWLRYKHELDAASTE